MGLHAAALRAAARQLATPRSVGLRLAYLVVLAASLGAFAQNLQPIPKLTARVTDLTGTLTAEQQSMLEEKLSAFEARKGAQVAVLVVPTTQPEGIAEYSIPVGDTEKARGAE